MKKPFILVFALLGSSPFLTAQDGRPPGGRGGGGQQGHGPQKSQLFAALDANSEGTIDQAEIANAVAALKRLDKNADGKITEDEARPAGGQIGQGGRPGREGERPRGEGQRADGSEMVATLMAFDKNADGKLSKDEVPERMQGIFARGDKDHDGFLTADEIKTAAGAEATGAGGQAGRPR